MRAESEIGQGGDGPLSSVTSQQRAGAEHIAGSADEEVLEMAAEIIRAGLTGLAGKGGRGLPRRAALTAGGAWRPRGLRPTMRWPSSMSFYRGLARLGRHHAEQHLKTALTETGSRRRFTWWTA